jgi:hypothetical protein
MFTSDVNCEARTVTLIPYKPGCHAEFVKVKSQSEPPSGCSTFSVSNNLNCIRGQLP